MIKIVVGRNITVLIKIELDNVRFESGEIVNSSKTLNGDEIDDVWNQSYDEKGPKTKRIKSNRSFLTDDEIRMMVSSNSSNELKHNFLNHQQKLNVSLNLCHEENTKTIDYYFADNKPDRGLP